MNGVLYSKDMKRLLCYPAGMEGDDYKILNVTQVVESCAFSGSQLISIEIPDSVTYIKKRAFDGDLSSSKLKEIHLRNEHPENIEIEESVFKGLSDCTLFVPIGTGYAYRHDERFKVFKEVKIER